MTISDYNRYLSQQSACFDTTESTTKSNNNSSELVAKTASNETNKVVNTINDTVIPQSAKTNNAEDSNEPSQGKTTIVP